MKRIWRTHTSPTESSQQNSSHHQSFHMTDPASAYRSDFPQASCPTPFSSFCKAFRCAFGSQAHRYSGYSHTTRMKPPAHQAYSGDCTSQAHLLSHRHRNQPHHCLSLLCHRHRKQKHPHPSTSSSYPCMCCSQSTHTGHPVQSAPAPSSHRPKYYSNHSGKPDKAHRCMQYSH